MEILQRSMIAKRRVLKEGAEKQAGGSGTLGPVGDPLAVEVNVEIEDEKDMDEGDEDIEEEKKKQSKFLLQTGQYDQ